MADVGLQMADLGLGFWNLGFWTLKEEQNLEVLDLQFIKMRQQDWKER